jgi:hypothetical protein
MVGTKDLFHRLQDNRIFKFAANKKDFRYYRV